MSWNPFSEEILENPASGHHILLENCPVHHLEGFDPPFYTISRYKDVKQALRDVDTFSSQFGQGPKFTTPQGMLCDPPKHTHMRNIVQEAFSPRAMEILKPIVTKTVNELLNEIMEGPPTFDLHDAFAFPLPVIIIADMLGVPTKDLNRFKYWSDIQVAAMGMADPTKYQSEQTEFFNYMHNHWATRRSELENGKECPNDLLTIIAQAKNPDDSPISEDDALSILTQLLVGGNETTTSLITNSIWRLLENPKQWQMLIANPSLASSVVEESLRFDPPVLGLYRTTTKDVRLHGTTMPKNSKVLINYAAANRDPRIFENPNVFNISRPRRRHMSFGIGVHFCLGAPMARLEAEIALSEIARKIPNVSLTGNGKRITPFFLWGRSKLPLRSNLNEENIDGKTQ